jgi:hypothetical protein
VSLGCDQFLELTGERRADEHRRPLVLDCRHERMNYRWSSGRRRCRHWAILLHGAPVAKSK